MRWARRAAALGYLQEIPGVDAPVAPARAASREPRSQRARLRRLAFEDAMIDLEAGTIRAAGHDFQLTLSEWTILENLASQVNRTVPRRELVKVLPDSRAQRGVHSLRHFIQSLRRKLEPDPTNPRYLVTEPTISYRLQMPRSLLTKEEPKG